MLISSSSSISCRGGANSQEADQTLEIMMSDLDPEVMAIFTKEVSANAADATRVRLTTTTTTTTTTRDSQLTIVYYDQLTSFRNQRLTRFCPTWLSMTTSSILADTR